MPTVMIAHGPWWRLARALLVAVHRASPLVLAGMLMWPDAWPWAVPDFTNPLRLARAFVIFCLIPGLAAWLIGRVFAGTVAIAGETLIVERLDRRLEMPCRSIRRLVAWRLPLPAAG